MRTVRCNSHLGMCLPSGVSAQGWGGECVSQHAMGQTPHLVDRILDTRLWKHYLSATTVADGKNSEKFQHLTGILARLVFTSLLPVGAESSNKFFSTRMHSSRMRTYWPPCEWNDWETGVKTLPCCNCVADGNKVGLGCPATLWYPHHWTCIHRMIKYHV